MDAPGYDETQYIKKIKRAYDDTIKEGARDVKLALEAYVMVAENYAYGPLFHLSGTGLTALGGKAFSLLSKSEKARVTATYMRGVLAKMQGVLPKLKAHLATLRAGSEEAAALARNVDELETGARKLASGADDLEEVAKAGNFVGGVTQHNVGQIQAADDVVQQATTSGGKLHIDVGGEGRYSAAVNLNPLSHEEAAANVGGTKIPNWVRARAEHMPFKDATADLITVENTIPLPSQQVAQQMGFQAANQHAVDTSAKEIGRVIKSGGTVVLENPKAVRSQAWQDAVVAAVGGTVRRETFQRVDSAGVAFDVIKTIITAP